MADASPKAVKKGGKKAKKSVKKSAKKVVTARGKLIRGNKTRKTFASAIKKVNKKGGKNGLSSRAVAVLNSFAFDILDRIASAAAGVARAAGKQTLNANAAAAAVKMVLPADLAKHSGAEAGKALAAYIKATPKKVAKKGAKSAPKK